MLEQDEVNVDSSIASLLNFAEHPQPAFESQVENLGMGMAMLDNHGWEYASHSVDGMHEGLALLKTTALVFKKNLLYQFHNCHQTESGMSLNGTDQLDLLQARVSTQQEQTYFQQQQISDLQQQNCLQHRQIQELGAQMLQFQNQQRLQQQQLQESRVQNLQ